MSHGNELVMDELSLELNTGTWIDASVNGKSLFWSDIGGAYMIHTVSFLSCENL